VRSTPVLVCRSQLTYERSGFDANYGLSDHAQASQGKNLQVQARVQRWPRPHLVKFSGPQRCPGSPVTPITRVALMTHVFTRNFFPTRDGLQQSLCLGLKMFRVTEDDPRTLGPTESTIRIPLGIVSKKKSEGVSFPDSPQPFARRKG